MNIAFRVDASNVIGMGHVMRCLTLADRCRKRGHDVLFVTRATEGNAIERIKEERFAVQVLLGDDLDGAETVSALAGETIDWLVVDHYGLDERWERAIRREVTTQLLVLDDTMDRRHDCTVLIDQNIRSTSPFECYRALTNEDCTLLFGSSYALIREEFFLYKTSEQWDHVRLFIYFGGADPTRLTLPVISSIERMFPLVQSELILSPHHPDYEAVARIVATMPHATLHTPIPSIASLLAQCTHGICAGGSTSWERCAVGLPSLVIPVAENQRIPMRELAKLDVLTLIEDPARNELPAHIATFLHMPIEEWQRQRRKGQQLFDGNGPLRIVQQMERIDRSGLKRTL